MKKKVPLILCLLVLASVAPLLAQPTGWSFFPKVTGSTSSGGDLWFMSTTNATKGFVYFGANKDSMFDEVNEYWGLGVGAVPCSTVPTAELDVCGTSRFSGGIGAITMGHNHSIYSTAKEIIASSTYGFMFTTNASTTAMLLEPDGQVAINPYSVGGGANDFALLVADNSLNTNKFLALNNNADDLLMAFGSDASGDAYMAMYSLAVPPTLEIFLTTDTGTDSYFDAGHDLCIGDTSCNYALLAKDNANTPFAVSRTSNDGHLVDFAQDGVVEGYISVTGTTVSYVGFSGEHMAQTDEEALPVGAVVVSTGELIPGSSEYPLIASTTIRRDQRVYGVYRGEDAEGDSDLYGFGEGRAFHSIACVGIVTVRVTDTAGDIYNGDYLTSSPRKWEGERQASEIRRNYTFAKSLEDVDWDEVLTDPVLGYKWATVSALLLN